jgi:hypothetical protein
LPFQELFLSSSLCEDIFINKTYSSLSFLIFNSFSQGFASRFESRVSSFAVVASLNIRPAR